MRTDDELGHALHDELQDLGSDIHPRSDLMHRILSDEAPQPRRVPAVGRRGLLRTPSHPGRRRRAPRRSGLARSGARWLVSTLAVAVAVVVAVFVVSAGGGSSVLARAYAATSTNGVIVHYLESFRGQQGNTITTSQTRVWISGQQRHLIITPGRGPIQEVAFDGSHEQNYMNGTMYTFAAPASLLHECDATSTLRFDCVAREPLVAVRGLYRSGRMHAEGQRTVDGRRVELITGGTGGLWVRALVDPRTFVPIQIRVIDQLHPPGPVPSIRVTTMITDYTRLPLTPQNRKLLLMRDHPHASVVHLCVGGTQCTKSHPR